MSSKSKTDLNAETEVAITKSVELSSELQTEILSEKIFESEEHHRQAQLIFKAAMSDEETAPAADNWLGSYGDFLTIFFGVFLILFAMQTNTESKQESKWESTAAQKVEQELAQKDKELTIAKLRIDELSTLRDQFESDLTNYRLRVLQLERELALAKKPHALPRR